MTASQIAQLVKGTILAGRGDLVVHGVAALEDASEDDASFYGSPAYFQLLRQSKAGVVLVPEDFAEPMPNVGVLIGVQNPSGAFGSW
jgi:UDP-3-O-[3-hydroxymyristoyl] glucosamine N-acyltransferase